MVLLIIIPFLHGYFIGKIHPTFSVTNPPRVAVWPKCFTNQFAEFALGDGDGDSGDSTCPVPRRDRGRRDRCQLLSSAGADGLGKGTPYGTPMDAWAWWKIMFKNTGFWVACILEKLIWGIMLYQTFSDVFRRKSYTPQEGPLPSGKHTNNYGISPFFHENPGFLWSFSIASGNLT